MNTIPIQQLSNDFHSGKLPSNEILQGNLINEIDVLGAAVHPFSAHTTLTPATALEVSLCLLGKQFSNQ